MFDAVPSRIVSEVRRCVQNCFTCRSYYFASRKGKRLISPAEQAEMHSVFRALCPELRPIYDSFEVKIRMVTGEVQVGDTANLPVPDLSRT